MNSQDSIVFSNLVIFSSFLIDLIYFGFSLITIILQHYVYIAWNVQTIALRVPGFIQQGDNFLTNLRQNLTPQEVVDWFGFG